MSRSGQFDPRAEYVVHTDRAAIHRRHGGILAVHGVLGAAVVAAIIWFEAQDLGPLSTLPMLIILVGQIFQLSWHSFIYGSRVAISEPLTLNHRGFAMNTAAGRMEVPWEAVTGIAIRRRLRYRMLVLQLHPAAMPGSPGVETDITPSDWKRLQRYGGPMLGEKGIRENLADIIAAVDDFSQGRVPVRS
ncbi:hypothetical protein [Microlunatus soli]|uniref:Uncharacterized protein n=1 Tax=Microlunatus soli TaxID=630515 RepID=A0A1H1ZT82_9ACTN|nr:hypothetical protein [Microlunatus soli]SDT36777.1 hypothetical protein SAMN04489812_5429 [Microlunatus soli]